MQLGIQQYFDSYFIGYNTHTELVKLKIIDEVNAQPAVQFTGDFSEGKIGGISDFEFKKDKIVFFKSRFNSIIIIIIIIIIRI